jgi:hypothetical protein
MSGRGIALSWYTRRAVRRTVAALLLAALSLGACTDDRVSLAYGLVPGRRFEYRLLLRAEVDRTLEGITRSQHVEATFRASQAIIERLEDGGARAEITLVPESLEVEGKEVEPGPGQEFSVRLGPDGRVVDIGEPTGEAREELAPVGLERLLPRLRPVLPGTEVAAGDTWSSETDFDDAGGSFSLSTESRLAELGVVGGYPAALVRTTYESPVNRRETFANALADLVGTDVGAQQAWFSLDGFLLRARGDSVGTYRITFRPPEAELGVTPVEGALVVRLHTEMDLVR